MTPVALVLDFDGVVLDSAGIKTAAFRALFDDRPAHAEAIAAYLLANQGVSRWRKFDDIHSRILREPLSDADRKRLGDRFAALIRQQMQSCPEIDGTRAFVTAARREGVPAFVASATPHDELCDIVACRSLGDVFDGIYGSPRSKSDIIAALAGEHGWRTDTVLMIGDATTDRDEARRAGTRFLGLTRDPGSFPSGTACVATLAGLSLSRCWALAAAATTAADG